MPQCKKCNEQFPNQVKIDGKARNLCNRKYCLECSPFGEHNTRKIHIVKKQRATLVKHYKYVKQRRKERKLKLVDLKGGKCYNCGYNKCYQSLDFHHKNPTEKEFGLSADMLARKSWSDVLKEVEKTILLCKNCHTEVECGMLFVR